jgi:hypothetical protein
MRELDVTVTLRPVLPGVIHIPDTFSDRSSMEQEYFSEDVRRTVEFLDLPFAEAQPSPANWQAAVGLLQLSKNGPCLSTT